VSSPDGQANDAANKRRKCGPVQTLENDGNKTLIQETITSTLNARKTSYRATQNLLSFRLVSRNVNKLLLENMTEVATWKT
jgi:hypothetical protein